MIEYFENDARRINHALKVYDFSSLIAYKESVSEEVSEIISYTAILHDIGIKEAERKYNSSAAEYQHSEGPPVAEKILTDSEISANIINRVKFIIANHHHYNKIDSIDFRILVEADFLVNIHEEGIKKEAIERIYRNFFRTESGKSLIKSMYL